MLHIGLRVSASVICSELKNLNRNGVICEFKFYWGQIKLIHADGELNTWF